jgi:hypothetical protein
MQVTSFLFFCLLGSSSGVLNVTVLRRGVDGNWTTSFRSRVPENLTLTLSIDSKPVTQASITVLNNSNPFYLDYNGTASKVQLTSQNLKVIEPVAGDSAMLVYNGENSQLIVPVLDFSGRR